MSIFPQENQLALSGELQAYLQTADEAVLKAAHRALDTIVSNSKEKLRDMVRAAGLGDRLANSVRGEIYPKQGLARNPAGWIYVREGAVQIFTAFETGATIRGKAGGFLAIPIPGSPADRAHFGVQRPGETRVQSFRNRGIKLSFVPASINRPAMLVAESVRVSDVKGRRGPTGRQRVANVKQSKSGLFGTGAASVPLFWLVPQAKMPKKLNWVSEFERISRDFMREFAAEFDRQLAIIQTRKRAA